MKIEMQWALPQKTILKSLKTKARDNKYLFEVCISNIKKITFQLADIILPFFASLSGRAFIRQMR